MNYKNKIKLAGIGVNCALLLALCLLFVALSMSCKNPYMEALWARFDKEEPEPDPPDLPEVFYTVSFDANGGSPVEPQTVAEGGRVERPRDPEKPKFDLDGWYRDGGFDVEWDFANDTVTGDITLYAKWDEIYQNGTEEYPFLIAAAADLQKIGNDPDWGLDKHYRQEADITLSGEWTPIGDNSTNDDASRFTGTYNGGGYKIENLTINTAYDYSGLFGYVGAGGTVTNVHPENVKIAGGRYTGGVAGGVINGGIIEHCSVSGELSTEWQYDPGSPGSGYIGGVVGNGGSGTIRYCYSSGSVSVAAAGNSVIAGGIAGTSSSGGRIENCYSTVDVSGINIAGGITGTLSNGGTVRNCYSTGAVTGNTSVGGINGSTSATGNTLQNNVSLNPGVTGATVGRVTGGVGGTVTNNHARSDMALTGGTVSAGANGKDGADITSAQWGSQTWWSGSAPSGAQFDFGPTGPWEWNGATNLPVLKGFPAGTQNHTVQ